MIKFLSIYHNYFLFSQLPFSNRFHTSFNRQKTLVSEQFDYSSPALPINPFASFSSSFSLNSRQNVTDDSH